MLLDYCLKPQSPCDDGLALDLVLSCDPSPCHLWVLQDASAVCVCVLSHLQIRVCASQTYFCLSFSSFDDLEKMSYCPFYCCRLCNPPDPAELSIVSPADRALGHISVWPW